MTRADQPTGPSGPLHAVYGAFMAAVREMDDETSWAPTGCTGGAARVLVFHCLTDAQRALTALHTPPERYPTGTRSGTGAAGRGGPDARRARATVRTDGRRDVRCTPSS
ncbi:hypothetical protein [Streptomyces lavendofoliae]|uniref:hypothetical protein n=1 Tax=Streptomyces lavendofoliae TaxID=67314 RepID=UPI003D90FC04